MAARRTKERSAQATSGDRAPRDLMIVTGKTDDGAVRVLRAQERTLSVGTLAPLAEGKPIHGEVVRLEPHAEHAGVYDVTTVLPAPTESTQGADSAARAESTQGADSAPRRVGPAQVSTDTYRTGWDRIYKRSRSRDLPN